MKLRALSYNIHKGVCYYSRKTVLDELRSALREVDPDIAFLQEVRGADSKSSLGPQFKYLAEELWPHFAYGQNAVYTQGHHGNAILSKYPITFQHNVDISTNRLERRGLLHAKVNVSGTPLDLFCIHMDLLERGRTLQTQRVVERIASLLEPDTPVLLAGDFNDWRTKISHRLKTTLGLEEAGLTYLGHHAKTFPSIRPTWPLDRIYYRGLKLSSYGVLHDASWQKLSDHLAVTASFNKR